MSNTYRGQCFCGAIEIEVTGEPEGMGYCHCESCRAWSAGPVNAFTLWDPNNVNVVKGKEYLRQYNKTENSYRKWCDKCGGHLMAGHPGLGLTDVYAAILTSLEFVPALHVNYAETVLRMKDGLPKMADFPSEFGGTGDKLPE
ncbi:GFA family protein [Maritimibacter sp. DP1N21-5]|uniref:GFA family protein n=1 Tax=Maritimibacter sp. DP1N21-5 TaxID=2836867 RepID=UPI001C4378FF|nr:GFA family protein [Maritimibacter sp. DP1N21-5]MBV7409729.1 GFA family protein [Maritimibacter sp. DP1N21-5]